MAAESVFRELFVVVPNPNVTSTESGAGRGCTGNRMTARLRDRSLSSDFWTIRIVQERSDA